MAARTRGNGTNFDRLSKSCDMSTCDLSPWKFGKLRKAYEISYRGYQSSNRYMRNGSRAL